MQTTSCPNVASVMAPSIVVFQEGCLPSTRNFKRASGKRNIHKPPYTARYLPTTHTHPDWVSTNTNSTPLVAIYTLCGNATGQGSSSVTNEQYSETSEHHLPVPLSNSQITSATLVYRYRKMLKNTYSQAPPTSKYFSRVGGKHPKYVAVTMPCRHECARVRRSANP